MSDLENVVVIGSGPAGLTAGLYLARAELKPLIIAGTTPGGQLMLTGEVENYPGFPEGISGPDLIEKMTKQAERFGARLVYENATGIDVTGQSYQVVTNERSYSTRAIILSTGAATRWLGVPGEQELIGKGISSCAVCDAPLFRDKAVFVVGGGDSAMEEALALATFAKSVTVLHRRDAFRASKIMQERVITHPKITVRWNTAVTTMSGSPFLSEIIVKDVVSGKEETLPAEGLFVAIGHEPITSFVKGTIDLDERGYIKVTRGAETSVEGVFVAGDVHDHHYKQAITAAGFGCMAALEAEKWISGL